MTDEVRNSRGEFSKELDCRNRTANRKVLNAAAVLDQMSS